MKDVGVGTALEWSLDLQSRKQPGSFSGISTIYLGVAQRQSTRLGHGRPGFRNAPPRPFMVSLVLVVSTLVCDPGRASSNLV